MASRRLAISSLLCGDAPSAAPVAGPSYSPRSDTSPSYATVRSPAQRDVQGVRTRHGEYQTESEYVQTMSEDVVPLSFQPVAHLRRHTPSPSVPSHTSPVTDSPARRRSFKEIAFDNYQGRPGSDNSPVSYPFDNADHRARSYAPRHDSLQINAVPTATEPTYPSPSRVYTIPEPSQSYQRPRRPSFSESLSRPPSSRHSTSSIHSLVNGPLQSPPTHRSSQQQPPTWSDHQRTPPPPQNAQTMFVPPSPAPRPSASPVQTHYRQPHSATVSPTFSTTSRVSSPPSSASSQRPRSRHAIASLLADSPPVPRASAASLPHILNSPTQPRQTASLPPTSPSHVTHMGGLEALVQAATQERRRLSGEMQAEVVASVVHPVSTSTVSSPVLARGKNDPRSSPLSERGAFTVPSPVIGRAPREQSKSPNMHRPSAHAISPLQSPTHILPSPLLSPVGASQTSFASIPPQPLHAGIRRAHSPPFGPEGEPPTKRRRGSNETVTSPSASRLLHVLSSAPPDSFSSQVPSARSPGSNRPAVAYSEPATQPSKSDQPTPPVNRRVSPVLQVKAEQSPALIEPQLPPQPTTKPSSPRIHSPARVKKPLSEDKKPPPPHSSQPQPESDSKTSLSLQARSRHDNDAMDKPEEVKVVAPVKRKRKGEGKALPREKVAKPTKAIAQEPTPSIQGSPVIADRADATEDEDPHDWLMEHYGGASSSHSIPQHGTTHEEKPSGSRPTLSRNEQSRGSGSSNSTSARSTTQAPKKVLKEPKGVRPRPKTRSPTPTAMLEEEIGAVEDDWHAHAAVKSQRGTTQPVHSRKADADVDMDLEAALDLVAGPRETDAGTKRKADDASEMDVEDELLSLLDDNPRPHRGSPHAHPPPEVSKAVSPEPAGHTPDQPVLPHASSSKLKHTMKHTDKSDRESMPPPPHTPDLAKAQDSVGSKKTDVLTSANTKKKDGATKPGAKKQTAAAKPKAPKASASKATGKASAHAKEGSSTPVPSTSSSALAVPTTGSNGKAKKTSPHPGVSTSGAGVAAKRAVSTTGGAGSRSRSTSVMPGVHETDKAGDKNEPEEEPVVDDKLYCVCKTKYDEDRVMIACDRCDEWYHTQCVNMPDLEVDLVDQFICPTCIASNPHLSLKTTYKRRCYSGLQHSHPSSPSACHKPARGAVSKYCSDECAVNYMQSKIRRWGGDKAGLWEGVKDADKREAVVMRCLADGEVEGRRDGRTGAKLNGGIPDTQAEVVKPTKTKIQREIDRLNSLLSRLPVRRDVLKKEEDILSWRENLIGLAVARADAMGECGWDQRLCFGDDEIAEFGHEVLQSYDQFKDDGTPDAMQVDGSNEWWCRGKKKCDRHAGWQKLRQAETELDREVLNANLEKVTAEERDLRNRIEDMLKEVNNSPTLGRKSSPSVDGVVPLKPVNGDGSATVDVSGANCARTKVNGVKKDQSMRKGKKRKPE